MVEVKRRTNRWIDNRLEWLTAYWAELPEVVREFDTWDVVEQLTYIEEWRRLESQRKELVEHARRGLLTPGQRNEYQELQRLVEHHRHILQRIMGG